MSKIYFISLGCDKNRIDAEIMAAKLISAGHVISDDIEDSDCVIINTCGFIDAAKSEAIDTVLQMAELKAAGRIKKIIVTGCLTERYKADFASELPEVDAVLGVGSFGDIVAAVESAFAGDRPQLFGDKNAPVEDTPRIVSTGPAWAYLRIALGVCTFSRWHPYGAALVRSHCRHRGHRSPPVAIRRCPRQWRVRQRRTV